jgi:hypothetical protein
MGLSVECVPLEGRHWTFSTFCIPRVKTLDVQYIVYPWSEDTGGSAECVLLE